MNAPALKTFTAVGAAGLALAFSACGSDDSTSDTSATPETAATTSGEATTSSADTGGSSSSSTIKIGADPSGAIAFTTGDLTAPAGADTIEFDNPSPTPHNVEIEDADGNVVGETDTISGSTASADVDLEPGTYTYFCAVSDHRAQGMEGTITVK